MVRSRFDKYIWLWLAISAPAACGSAQHATDTSPGAPGSGEPATGEEDATRGMGIEVAPDAVPGEPFILEATLHARRLESGVSVSRGELHDGDTVMSGDRIQISVRTTRDAHLYLAFCSQQAANPRYPGLTVYPPKDSIPVKANETTIVPNQAAEIVIDDKPGREALYLILSRTDLPMADPHIDDAIAAARRGTATVDCGDPLHLANRGSPKVTRKVVKRARKAPHPVSGLHSGTGVSTGSGLATPPPPSALVVSTETGEPFLNPTRGGQVVWAHGGFGLVVLRYGLQHVSAP